MYETPGNQMWGSEPSPYTQPDPRGDEKGSHEKKGSERRHKELSLQARVKILADVADVLSSSAELSSALRQITSQAMKLAGAGAASLFLYDEAGELERASYVGLSAHFAHELDKLGRTEWIGQYLAGGKKPLVLEIAPGARQPSPIHKLAASEGMALCVSVPLTSDTQLMGLLILYHPRTRAYAPADFELLRAFSNYVALSLANMRLEQARKWERRAQDGFLDALGHELRTPLTSILGFTQMVRKRMSDFRDGPAGDRRLRDQLDLIWAQAQRMNRLLDTFVDISNIERGEFTVEHVQLDLVDTLRRSMTQARTQGGSRHEITLDAPDTGLVISGDVRRLEHMFTHLISNAIKYSPDSKLIAVACHDNTSRHEVTVTISDRGQGISGDLHRDVFKRFFPSDTRKAGGLGVGLYASRAIVEAHGGRLTLTSEPGRGTTVTVVLPIE